MTGSMVILADREQSLTPRAWSLGRRLSRRLIVDAQRTRLNVRLVLAHKFGYNICVYDIYSAPDAGA